MPEALVVSVACFKPSNEFLTKSVPASTVVIFVSELWAPSARAVKFPVALLMPLIVAVQFRQC